MIHPFLAAMGVALCALGFSGMALGPWTVDPVHLRSILPYDGLYLVSGILAFMSLIEQRWIARCLCVAIGAVHAMLVILELARTTPTLDLGSVDLCVSAVVAVSCLTAGWRSTVSARQRVRGYRTASENLPSARPAEVAGIR